LEMESLYEFDEMIDSSLPPVTYIWVTLSNIFLNTFHLKKKHKG
jgi:hypothetical protein